MQGGVIINREGFAYQKDLNILNARLSALEAEVASLRINQHRKGKTVRSCANCMAGVDCMDGYKGRVCKNWTRTASPVA